MNGPGRLPAAEDARVPGEAVDYGWRHCNSCSNRERTKNQDHGEVGNLLQGVVAVKPIWLRRQMQGSVMDPHVPALQKHKRGGGHNAPPLLGGKQQTDENNSCDDEAMHVDEVPDARDADGMPVAWRAHQGRDITGVIFRGPQAVAGDLNRRDADPFSARRAAVIEIQPRMVHENGEAAANQQHHKQKIEEMAVAHPEWKPMRPGKIAGIDLGRRRYGRESGHGIFDPGSNNYRDESNTNPDQDGRPHPDAKAPVRRIVDGSVSGVKLDHVVRLTPNASWRARRQLGKSAAHFGRGKKRQTADTVPDFPRLGVSATDA